MAEKFLATKENDKGQKAILEFARRATTNSESNISSGEIVCLKAYCQKLTGNKRSNQKIERRFNSSTKSDGAQEIVLTVQARTKTERSVSWIPLTALRNSGKFREDCVQYHPFSIELRRGRALLAYILDEGKPRTLKTKNPEACLMLLGKVEGLLTSEQENVLLETLRRDIDRYASLKNAKENDRLATVLELVENAKMISPSQEE